MIESVEQITQLFEAELARISDPLVAVTIKSFAVIPKPQERKWYYGPEPDIKYLCWLVMEHTESQTGIAYSDFGFGPKNPWGLVSLNAIVIGDDAGWFKTLEGAFYESFASEPLDIWNVIQTDSEGKFRLIAESLSGNMASNMVQELYEANKYSSNLYFREPRNYPYYSRATQY